MHATAQVDWSLKACGTAGMLEVSRGGWSGNRGSYVLTWKGAKDAEPRSKSFSFTGVPTEFTSFINLVSSPPYVLNYPKPCRGLQIK